MDRLSKILQDTHLDLTPQDLAACATIDDNQKRTGSPCLGQKPGQSDNPTRRGHPPSGSSQADTISPERPSRRRGPRRKQQVFCVEARHYPVYDRTNPRHNSALRNSASDDKVKRPTRRNRSAGINRQFSWRKSLDNLFHRKSQNEASSSGAQTSSKSKAALPPQIKKSSSFSSAFSSLRSSVRLPVLSKRLACKEQLSRDVHHSTSIGKDLDDGTVGRGAVSDPRANPHRHPIPLNGQVPKNGEPYPRKRLSRQEQDELHNKSHTPNPEGPAPPYYADPEGKENVSRDTVESSVTLSPKRLQEPEPPSAQHHSDLLPDTASAEHPVPHVLEKNRSLSRSKSMNLPNLRRFDYPCIV